MSIKVMSEVWEKSQFRGSDLLTLLALADWSNDDGWSWHGVDGIAQKIRVERRTVIYIFEKLSTAGELVVHRNVGPHGTNLYWVAVGVQSFAPPPDILGLTVVEAPTYRAGTLVRGAKFSRGISPETLLNVIDGGDVKKEGESSPPEDSVQPTAPVQEIAPPDDMERAALERFLRASRVGKNKRETILSDPEATLPYVQKWFVYSELRGFDVGLAIVNVLDHLPEPKFCDFCGGVDQGHRTVGVDSWGDPCPRDNNGALTTKECEKLTDVDRAIHLVGVD